MFIHRLEGELTELPNYFYSITHNGVDIVINPASSMFNASLLLSQLSKHIKITKSFTDWRKQDKVKRIINFHPEWVCHKESTDSSIRGYYLSINLLEHFVYTFIGVNTFLWLAGDEDWSNLNNEGFVYLIQRLSDNGTDVYKVGCTSNPKARFSEYGKNQTDILVLQYVPDMKETEKVIIQYFNKCYNRAVKDKNNLGKEYFHIPSREQAIRSFNTAISLT